MVKLNAVRDDIKKLSNSVELMAVSKTHPYSAILECYELGQRLFGENRVQEIEEKFPKMEERPQDMYLALIGHLQSNKVKKAVALVDRIDSVDSIKLLLLINKECEKLNKVIDILFEVNSSGEEQKSGFTSKEELFEAVKLLKDLKFVHLRGIMTVGPLGDDREKNIKAFKYTKKIFDEIKSSYISDIDILSMGMSGDYKEAIECGSNLVRIGTAIFGQRDYNV